MARDRDVRHSTSVRLSMRPGALASGITASPNGLLKSPWDASRTRYTYWTSDVAPGISSVTLPSAVPRRWSLTVSIRPQG